MWISRGRMHPGRPASALIVAALIVCLRAAEPFADPSRETGTAAPSAGASEGTGDASQPARSTISPENSTPSGSPSITGTRPARAGALCSLCGRVLGADDVAHRIKGRWIQVHAGRCEDALREDPQAAFAAHQPRGALFQEEFGPKPLRWGWFIAGAYVLLGLACAALCGHLAYPRRRSAARWFVAGLILNVIAVGALLATAGRTERVPPRLGRIHDTADPLPCRACGGGNHPSASRCSGCGARLTPASDAEVRRAITGRA